jgi:hypothetical protein
MAITARWDTCLSCLCHLTAQAATFPVNPILYALMNRQLEEWLMNLQITSLWHASKAEIHGMTEVTGCTIC